jgi:Na+/proline symporter
VVWTDFVQTWALCMLLGGIYFQSIRGLAHDGVHLGVLDMVLLNWGLPDLTRSLDAHWPSWLRLERPFWDLLHREHKLLDPYFWNFHLELPLQRGVGTQVNVWGYVAGLVLNVPCAQNQIQRWLTCRDDRELKRSIYWGLLIGLLFPGVAAIGVLIFANYSLACQGGPGSSPSSNGTVDWQACAIATVNASHPVPPLHGNADRVLGFYVVHALPRGFAGGLLAVLFASAMSVFSGNLNGVATCMVLDGYRLVSTDDLDGPTTIKWVRRATWLIGLAAMGLACSFVAVGGILRINTTLSGLLSGSPGVFLLGMVTTRANSQGALIGLLTSVVLAAYFLISQAPCPDTVSASSCAWVWRGGHLSFFFYGPVEILWTFCVGYLASYGWPAPQSHQTDGLTIWSKRGSTPANSVLEPAETQPLLSARTQAHFGPLASSVQTGEPKI